MSTVWVHAAAGCAAIASWLYKAPSRHDSRLPGEEPAVAHDCGSSWTILISVSYTHLDVYKRQHDGGFNLIDLLRAVDVERGSDAYSDSFDMDME